MATRIAWLLNLDAERELDDPKHYARSPEMEARIAQLRARMTLLLASEDCVIGQQPHGEAQEVLAFCPTPSALQRIEALGLRVPPAPSLAVLRQVNSRAFCAALGQTLPNAHYVVDLPSLQDVLASANPPGGWLLKRDFGFAGRERRRLLETALDASTLGFARRSFARQQGLQVEPWCERTHDFALHGYVFRNKRVMFGPPYQQVCDVRGSWQSSAELPAGALTDLERTLLEASARLAAHALAQAGYFGPFGIDAFRYLDRAGAQCFQPRSEINARFSMGYPRGLLEDALLVPDYRPS